MFSFILFRNILVKYFLQKVSLVLFWEPRSEGLTIEINHRLLSHVGPENFLGATLSEDEFQGIFKTNFSWLPGAKDQVARDLNSTKSSLWFDLHPVL